MAPENIKDLAAVLEIPEALIDAGVGAHWFPNRGLGTTPPTDPVIYRLYEVIVQISRLLPPHSHLNIQGVLVYGHPIKVWCS